MPIGSGIVYNTGDLILSQVSSSGTAFLETKIAASTSSIVYFDSNARINSASLNSITVGTASYVSGSTSIITNLTASNISASGTGSFGIVGIGTTSPSEKLHVVGNGLITSGSAVDLRIDVSGTGNASLTIDRQTTGAESKILLLDGGASQWGIAAKAASNNFVIRDADSTERFTILKSGGNVGIGMTSPTTRLHVSGSVTALDGRFVSNVTSGTDRYFLDCYGTSTNQIFALYENSNTAYLNSYSSMAFRANQNGGSGGYFVFSGANVGIGTSIPVAPLDVVGSTLTAILRNSTAASYGGLRIYNDQNSSVRALEIDYAGSTYTGPLVTGGPTGESAAITTTGAYPLSFGTNNTSRVVISGGGLVGIGTNNPGSRLEVQFPTNPATDNGAGNNVLRVWTSASFAADVGGAIGLGGTYNTSSYQSFGQIAGRKTNALSSSNAGYLQFATTNTAGTMAEWMRIDAGGNVGIGVTSPSGRLHITGSSTASETLLYLSKGSGSITQNYINAVNQAGQLNYRASSDQNGHLSHEIYYNGTVKVSHNTYWPSFINNDSYTNGGLGIGTTSTTHGYALNISRPATSGSLYVSGSSIFTGSVSINGSLNATASWATNALTASFLPVGTYNITSSWSTNALTASSVTSTSNAFIRGGNSFGANAMLGLNDNFRLDIETNGVAVISLTGSNVGIGTTSPIDKLHVSGSITAGTNTSTFGTTILQGYYTAGSLTVLGTEQSSGGPVLGYAVTPSTSSSAAFLSSTSITIPRSAYTQDGGTHRWYIGASQTVGIGSAASLSEVMRINSSGNIGIGTTNPVAKLQVAGNVSGSSFTSSISNAVGFLGTASWAQNVVSSSYATTAQTANALNSANSYTITNLTASGAIKAGSAIININGNLNTITGNVTTMGYNLTGSPGNTTEWVTVYTSQNALSSNDIVSQLAYDNYVNEKLYTRYSSNYGVSWSLWKTIINSDALTGSANYIPKFTGANTVGNSAIYDSSGNIGIGTTSPSYKLHVSGSGQTIIALDANTTTNVAQFQAKANGEGVAIMGMYGSASAGNNYGVAAASQAFIGTSTLGSNHPSSFVIGNVSSIPIVFSTTNTERMRITSGGNVGIGTTGPGAPLDVIGPTATAILRTATATSSSYAGLRIYNDQNSGFRALEIDYAGSAYTGPLITSGPTGESACVTTTGNYPLSIGTNNTARMTILGGGNVGIGTTVPVAKLQVAGNISGSSFTSSISNAVGFLGTSSWANNVVSASFATTAQTANALNVSNTYTIAGLTSAYVDVNGSSAPTTGIYRPSTKTLGLSADSTLIFKISNVSAPATSSIETGNFVIQSGNFGLGTNSPNNKLDIFGGTGTTLNMSNVDDGNRGGKLTFISSSATGRQFYVGTNSSIYNLVFGIDSIEKMRLDTNGNLGIGTTSPSVKLAVEGGSIATVNITGSDVRYSFDIRTLVGGAIGFNNAAASNVYGAVTGSAYFGVAQSYPIVFTTAGAERMRLDSTGGINIGTPSQLNSSRVSIADSAVKTSAGNCLTFATATGGSNDFQLIISRGSNTNGYYALQSVEQGVGYKNIVFNQDGGNIGIGTTNPIAKLQVAGNISGSSFTSSISNAVGFLGTSSWANNVVSASFATTAQTANSLNAANSYTVGSLNSTTQLGGSSGTLVSNVTPGVYATGTSTGNAIGIISNTTFANNGAIANIGLNQSSSNANDITAKVHMTIGGWYQNSGTGIPIYLGNGYTIESSPTMVIAPADANGGGNVGIGTTNPIAKLHVVGNISGSSFTSSISNAVGFLGTSSWAQNVVSASFATTAQTANALNASNTYTVAGLISAYVDVTGAGTIPTTGIYRPSTKTLGLSADGTLIFKISNVSAPATSSIETGNFLVQSGNVGIGTTNPTDKLTVYGALASYKTGADTIQTQVYLANGGNTRAFNLQLNSGGTGLDLWSYNSANAWLRHTTFDYDGRVGIGTAAPAAKLEISGSSNSALLHIKSPISGAILYVSGSGAVGIGTSNVGAFTLQVSGSFGATTKSFIIDHPTKAGKKLMYGSLESPYHGIRLTGRDTLVNGKCKIQLPDYMYKLILHDSVNIQLTGIKCNKTLYVDEINIPENYFTIAYDKAIFESYKDYDFFWDFTAIRADVPELITEL